MSNQVTVFDHPLSPYGQKVKIALLEKGIEFEAPLPEGVGAGSKDMIFSTASPRGEVPALVDPTGVKIFDSTIILEYIEDRWPEPPLLPKDPLQRARVRMLEDTMDTHFEAITWGLAEVRFFGRAQGELAETIEINAADQLKGWYAWLSKQLGTRPWFNGAEFGWGDLAVVPFVNAAVRFGFAPGDALAEWLVKVNLRPSVEQCRVAADAAAFDGPNMNLEELKAAVEMGLFKREYRDHRLEWMIKSGGLAVVEAGMASNNIRFTDVFS